ncbi:MAG TPA: hydrogenase 3 maturation endopeptidase HyCI [Clostridia bacterium]
MTELKSYLTEKILKGQRTAIMGVGSVLRSDDGAGMYFIELLETDIQQEDVLFIAGSTAPENFTGVIKDFAPDRLFIIDAAYMGLPVGEAGVIETADIAGMSFSTHMLPLSVMFDYLALETGCDIVCIGIQPENTGQGFEMCGKVRTGAEWLAKRFGDALHNLT